MDTRHAAIKGGYRLSASAEQISRKKTRDRVYSARSDDAIGLKKSCERSIEEGSLFEEGLPSPGRSDGPKDGQSRSVFSSFIDGVRNLASRLSERTGIR